MIIYMNEYYIAVNEIYLFAFFGGIWAFCNIHILPLDL